MSLTDEQKNQLNKLIEHRDQVIGNLFYIEQIIKTYFPEEFDIAYQHWIPQIITALYEDKRWLSRGEQTMQNSLNRIIDKSQEKNDQSVSKIF